MSREYYISVGKPALLNNPSAYAWNNVLYYLQFTQSELLEVRDHYDVKDIIYYQSSVTRSFLKEHFIDEINNSLEVDWQTVEKYVRND
jgi:hypothetical protein